MSRNGDPVHILIEPLGDHALNLGDVAMRQVAARRLRELWPAADIRILTKEPVDNWLSGVGTVDVHAQRAWSHPAVPDRLLAPLPDTVSNQVRNAERNVRTRWPRRVDRVIATKRRLRRQQAGQASEFLDAVLGSDLVLISGAGAINDHFGSRLSAAFDLLSLAARQGIPTALMGQGIGPLSDGAIIAVARRVLPGVKLIGLREERLGRALLTRLGVSPERIVTTGDDAVELAYELRTNRLDDGLGLNVRVAGYVPLEHDDLEMIARGLERFLRSHNVDVVPVPTSRHAGEADLAVAKSVAERAGVVMADAGELRTPEEAVRRVSRCRVVITGSYHAAVFALAQGISAVCLAPNDYYVQKFAGLADLFGPGCSVAERRADGGLEIGDALERAWSMAPRRHDTLLEAARRQVDLGRAAYARLRGLVDERT